MCWKCAVSGTEFFRVKQGFCKHLEFWRHGTCHGHTTKEEEEAEEEEEEEEEEGEQGATHAAQREGWQPYDAQGSVVMFFSKPLGNCGT